MVEQLREFIKLAKALRDSLPDHWHDDAVTDFDDAYEELTKQPKGWKVGDRVTDLCGYTGRLTVVEPHGVYLLPDTAKGIGFWRQHNEVCSAPPTIGDP